jgi:hypothetical protein
MSARILAVMVLSAAAAAACESGFEPEYLVKDLRVLAASVDPPELTIPIPPEVAQRLRERMAAGFEGGGAGGDNADRGMFSPDQFPQFSLPVSFSVLLADGQESTRIYPFRLQACTLEGSQCAADAPAPVVAEGTVGVGESTVDAQVPSDALFAAAQADMFMGYYGFAVWLRGEIDAGEAEPMVFVKALLVYPDFTGDRVPNRNPAILDILVGEKDKEEPVPLNAAGRFEVKLGSEHRVLPFLAPEDRERYTVVTYEGEVLELEEYLTVGLYSTCGDFDSTRASEEPDMAFDPEDVEKTLAVTWTAPSDGPAICTIWFVVTDGRGGEDWHILDVDVTQ